MQNDNQPMATLTALTIEAKQAVEGEVLAISSFPYRVGRDSRGDELNYDGRDRRRGNSKPNNDLYLVETTELFYVSREHFEIVFEEGEFWLVDRGSALGTWVGGRKIGGKRRGGRTVLRHGDVIIVGSHKSGFIFQFADVTAVRNTAPAEPACATA